MSCLLVVYSGDRQGFDENLLVMIVCLLRDALDKPADASLSQDYSDFVGYVDALKGYCHLEIPSLAIFAEASCFYFHHHDNRDHHLSWICIEISRDLKPLAIGKS
jgi:hypothetical protein